MNATLGNRIVHPDTLMEAIVTAESIGYSFDLTPTATGVVAHGERRTPTDLFRIEVVGRDANDACRRFVRLVRS